MIKAKLDSPDGPILIFGLSADNIRQLTAGRPIAIDLRELGANHGRVLILYGRTEEVIAAELQRAGLDFSGATILLRGPGYDRP